MEIIVIVVVWNVECVKCEFCWVGWGDLGNLVIGELLIIIVFVLLKRLVSLC